ncbi:hypothetical protein JHK82_047950 [Glycine max]|nr:hypothetical protein JHK82_047950 [Glycine max]
MTEDVQGLIDIGWLKFEENRICGAVLRDSNGNDGEYEFLGDDNVDEGEEETLSMKEKCVLAVMRCFDREKIYVKAGDEGNDVVAFL